MQPKDYKYIWAYGKIMGSMDYYILSVQETAAEEEAPPDAYLRREGEWKTLDDIGNERLRAEVEAKAERYPGEVFDEEEEEEDY